MQVITRHDAIVKGLKKYFTGIPCLHGHISERTVNKYSCIECNKISAKIANKNTDFCIYSKKYYYKNKEKVLLRNKQWNENNKEKTRFYINKPKRNFYSAIRRLEFKRHIPIWFNEQDTFFILEAYTLAALRLEKTGFVWHVDHMLPLRAKNCSGLHVWNNIQVIPKSLNVSKLNKMVYTERNKWLQSI